MPCDSICSTTTGSSSVAVGAKKAYVFISDAPVFKIMRDLLYLMHTNPSSDTSFEKQAASPKFWLATAF